MYGFHKGILFLSALGREGSMLMSTVNPPPPQNSERCISYRIARFHPVGVQAWQRQLQTGGRDGSSRDQTPSLATRPHQSRHLLDRPSQGERDPAAHVGRGRRRLGRISHEQPRTSPLRDPYPTVAHRGKLHGPTRPISRLHRCLVPLSTGSLALFFFFPFFFPPQRPSPPSPPRGLRHWLMICLPL